MRRKLFVVAVLALLVTLVPSAAFAAKPPAVEGINATEATITEPGMDLLLGDVLYFFLVTFDPVTGDYLYNWPVGIYLYRPDTWGGYTGRSRPTSSMRPTGSPTTLSRRFAARPGPPTPGRTATPTTMPR